MPEVFGSGDFSYTFADGWAKLPDGMTFKECPGVAVDSRDNVYVLTRGEHPIIVLDKDGNYIRSFGEGLFSDDRTHGLYIAQDDSVLVADDGIHTIQKFNSEGEKIMEIGERNHPAPKWSGQPFNRPTSAAIMPSNGDVYVSDGYGNSRIHVYTGSGEYKFSWGSPGIDAGQFIRPTISPSTPMTRFTWWTGKPTEFKFSTPRATSSPCGTTFTGRTPWSSGRTTSTSAS